MSYKAFLIPVVFLSLSTYYKELLKPILKYIMTYFEKDLVNFLKSKVFFLLFGLIVIFKLCKNKLEGNFVKTLNILMNKISSYLENSYILDNFVLKENINNNNGKKYDFKLEEVYSHEYSVNLCGKKQSNVIGNTEVKDKRDSNMSEMLSFMSNNITYSFYTYIPTNYAKFAFQRIKVSIAY